MHTVFLCESSYSWSRLIFTVIYYGKAGLVLLLYVIAKKINIQVHKSEMICPRLPAKN